MVTIIHPADKDVPRLNWAGQTPQITNSGILCRRTAYMDFLKKHDEGMRSGRWPARSAADPDVHPAGAVA
jgi:hypothetical protein